ncbi:HAD family hydrolase [Sphingobium sp. CR28]|uniref:HAD family hydrolase n=1 Tax=Sphingobium sp. CR28 TaxID=3400272 RepID=UPI003FEE19B8
MRRPLIISDCDEVLLHMVVPFRAWLEEIHDIHFDFSLGFEDALRHKASGDPVTRAQIWPLLSAFFETEMARQSPIAGAVEAMNRLAERADIVILTNIGDTLALARTTQLSDCGLAFPVVGNHGGKGPAVARLIAAADPLVTIFVDDLQSNHVSVAASTPGVWRLHMVGEPEMAGHYPPAPEAHARLDDWARAERWIAARIEDAERSVARFGYSRP